MGVAHFSVYLLFFLLPFHYHVLMWCVAFICVILQTILPGKGGVFLFFIPLPVW